MNQVPFEPRFETGQRFDQLPLDSFHREQRHEAHERSHLQRQISPARRVQDIIVKLVLLVPKTDPAAADIVHCRGDAEKMFEELCGDIFINMILARELNRDPHQVKRKHSHPTGAIALLEMAPIGERGVSVEHTDVVEPEKAALENVLSSESL